MLLKRKILELNLDGSDRKEPDEQLMFISANNYYIFYKLVFYVDFNVFVIILNI